MSPNLVPALEVTTAGVINLASATALSLAAPKLSILVGTQTSPPIITSSLDLGAEPGTLFPDLSVALELQALLTAGVTPVWDSQEALTATTATAAITAIAAAATTPSISNNVVALQAIGVWLTSIQVQLSAINTTMKAPGVGQTITTKAN